MRLFDPYSVPIPNRELSDAELLAIHACQNGDDARQSCFSFAAHDQAVVTRLEGSVRSQRQEADGQLCKLQLKGLVTARANTFKGWFLIERSFYVRRTAHTIGFTLANCFRVFELT
jgi:hypothetical protein